MTLEEHLFISDVHLGAFHEEKNTEIEQSLINLVEYAIEKKSALYILGDLFDYWMEYPDSGYVPDFGNKVLDLFEKYNKEVKPAIFVTGNHDNWTFGHFEDRGFDVEPRSRVLGLGSHKALIMHGDGKFGERDDFLRPTFHRLLRSSTFVKYYQKVLPPKMGIALMKTFSNITRKRNHSNPLPLSNHAERIVNTKAIDIVLCGHDHLPRMETFNGGTYINLGTFFKHRTMVRYINDTFSLVTWNSDSKEFVHYVD